MRKKLLRKLLLSGVLPGLVACDPLPERGDLAVTLASPTSEQQDVPLLLETTASIEGDFTLTASPCDPANVVTSDDLAANLLYPVQPRWDPDACLTEDGEPTEGEGNIQLFVDGVFLGYYTDARLTIDLRPKLSFALYDTTLYDADGDPETTDCVGRAGTGLSQQRAKESGTSVEVVRASGGSAPRPPRFNA